MSALAHPNDLDAIEHRNNTIRHAARTLYRDPAWIGHIKTGDWLLRIHYLEEVLKELAENPKVWFATLGEIVDSYLTGAVAGP